MSPTTGWTADQIPDLSGRTLIVTGGNSGLGLETTRELARHGARVVLACRSLEKARAAIARHSRREPARGRRGDGARPREPRLGALLRVGVPRRSTASCMAWSTTRA